jgi:Kef-type K+ transport system membrane component KefB
MVLIFGLLIGGIFLGYLLRNIKKIEKRIDFVTTISIFTLLFMMGVSVGSNKLIISNLATIGLDAFLLTLGGVVFTILISFLVFKVIYKKIEF